MIRTATATPAGTKHRLKEIRELSIIAGGGPIRTSAVREATAKAATLLAILLPLSFWATFLTTGSATTHILKHSL